jgi:threonylcarbamoyladenosine tRNA methylthiotransferase MtaB
MNRHYDTAEYARIVSDIRDCFAGKNPSITTDIMTGFPGETEQEHAESMAFAEQIGLAQMHVFDYSVREGTPAAKLPQIAPAIKSRRTAEMLAVKKRAEQAFLETQRGKFAEVLLESHITVQEETNSLRAEGYTRNYTPVYVEFSNQALPNRSALRGKILQVQLTGIENGHMVAKSSNPQSEE